MIDRIPTNIGPTGAEPVRGKRVEGVDKNPPPAAFSTTVPATPPHEVLASLDTAAGVYAELQSSGLGFHFAIEGDDKSPRLAVQLHDAEGSLVREIAPSQLLDVLSGGSRGVAIDAQG